MKDSQIQAFQKTVYDFYADNARTMPWRTEPSPYYVFISEIMLQQTQVLRVIEKFTEWIKVFPDFHSLASASLAEVLTQWQGLGYNRRAKFTHEAAKRIVEDFDGTLPKSIPELEKLPGIGPATARSIYVYTFNRPIAYIETNVRAVFIHECFADQEGITDEQIYPLVEMTIDELNPRKWYSALMDYGTHLKKIHKNPSRRSAHHTKQSKFEGSDRQIRGAIIRLLTQNPKGLTEKQLEKEIADERFEKIKKALLAEKMIHKKGNTITL